VTHPYDSTCSCAACCHTALALQTACRMFVGGAALMRAGSPRPRGAAVTSPVSACDCHLSPRPRPRDLPDPNCPRCLGSGEVTCG